MKQLIFSTLLLLHLSAYAQKITALEQLSSKDSTTNEQSIIYGNFIQRLGFSSGGFAQDIRIMNVDSKQFFSIRVNKSAKENTFIKLIPPGKYIIINYWWTQSKVYGAKMFTEPIFKGIDATDRFGDKIKSGALKESELIPYQFTIKENSINYLDTWHFEKGLVSFSNGRAAIDKTISAQFKNINLEKATTVIPD